MRRQLWCWAVRTPWMLSPTLAALGCTAMLGTLAATTNDQHQLPPNTLMLSVGASLQSAASTIKESLPLPGGLPHIEGYPQGHSVGPGTIGMWTVTDHDGKQFEDTNLLGQYALLSFGSAAEDKEGAQHALRHMHDLSDRVVKLCNMRIQAALVTNTPTKDSPGALRSLVTSVGPEVWALTGDECSDLAEAAIDFLMRFTPFDQKVNTPRELQGLVFLVNPAGEFVGVWKQEEVAQKQQAGDVCEDIAEQVRAWKQRHTDWLGPWGPHSVKPRVA